MSPLAAFLKSRMRGEAGSALLAAVLVTLLASALSASLVADALADVRMTLFELERESTIRIAQSMLRLALAQIQQHLYASRPARWDALLLGPDGVRAACSLSEWNPVDPADAARTPLLSLQNRCADDGTLPAAPGAPPIVGKAGLLVWIDDAGVARLLPLADTHACSPCQNPAHGAAQFQAWFKLSDNPEADADPVRDSDGLALLRLVVAHRYRTGPAGLPPAAGPMNTVVTLEAWLQHAAGGMLRVIAVREILP